MYVPIPIIVGAGILLLLLLVGALRPRRGGGRGDLVAPPAPVAAPAELQVEVRRLLAAGNKIEAIKLARETTGLGLKEAKDFVEALDLPAR